MGKACAVNIYLFILSILLKLTSASCPFQEIDLCHYSGSVRDKPGSWVAVSTCHGVQGIVFDGERMRYIEPGRGTLSQIHFLKKSVFLQKCYLPVECYDCFPSDFEGISNCEVIDT